MSVIDGALRFSQCHVVLTHDEIRAELVARLEAKTLTAKAVAAHLRIAPPRVTEMRKGERRVQPAEMAPLAAFLGMAGEVKEDAHTAEVVEIMERIAPDQREQALRTLRSFVEPQSGTGG